MNAGEIRQKSFLLEAQGDPWYLQAQVQDAEEDLCGLCQGLAEESIVVQLPSAPQRGSYTC